MCSCSLVKKMKLELCSVELKVKLIEVRTDKIETKNNLSENGYEHITMLRDISVPDLDLVRQVEAIEPGKAEGDCMIFDF